MKVEPNVFGKHALKLASACEHFVDRGKREGRELTVTSRRHLPPCLHRLATNAIPTLPNAAADDDDDDANVTTLIAGNESFRKKHVARSGTRLLNRKQNDSVGCMQKLAKILRVTCTLSRIHSCNILDDQTPLNKSPRRRPIPTKFPPFGTSKTKRTARSSNRQSKLIAPLPLDFCRAHTFHRKNDLPLPTL